jgi:hypothetical protein
MSYFLTFKAEGQASLSIPLQFPAIPKDARLPSLSFSFPHATRAYLERTLTVKENLRVLSILGMIWVTQFANLQKDINAFCKTNQK